MSWSVRKANTPSIVLKCHRNTKPSSSHTNHVDPTKTQATQNKKQIRYDDVVPGAYLTAQEARCIQALLEYGQYAKVAERLGISTRTVETYLTNIRRKFHCRNKCDVVRLFHRIGIEARK